MNKECNKIKIEDDALANLINNSYLKYLCKYLLEGQDKLQLHSQLSNSM